MDYREINQALSDPGFFVDHVPIPPPWPFILHNLITAAGIDGDKKGPLFRSFKPKFPLRVAG